MNHFIDEHPYLFVFLCFWALETFNACVDKWLRAQRRRAAKEEP